MGEVRVTRHERLREKRDRLVTILLLQRDIVRRHGSGSTLLLDGGHTLSEDARQRPNRCLVCVLHAHYFGLHGLPMPTNERKGEVAIQLQKMAGACGGIV